MKKLLMAFVAVAMLLCIGIFGMKLMEKDTSIPAPNPSESPNPTQSVENITPEQTDAVNQPEESKEEMTEPKKTTEILPISSATDFYFSSGAGAWGTQLALNVDGGFTGYFGDSDANVHYYCDFSGQFTDIEVLNDYSYSLTLDENLVMDEVGQEHLEGEITYITAEPYGLDGGTEFVFYDTNTPVDVLPEELLWWCHYDLESRDTLGCYAIYNVSEELAFFSEEIL